jgi:hypothetical protein
MVDEAGRSCPYCRFALKEGASIVECGACHALHHAECWGDNAGCAIMGCTGGAGVAQTAATAAVPPAPVPATVTAAVPPPPAYGQPTQVHAVAPPPPYQQQPAGYATAPPPGGGTGRSSTALILAVLVLALAVAGGATALVVSGGSSAKAGGPAATITQVVAQQHESTSAVDPSADGSTITDETTPTDTTTTDDEPATNGVLPDADQDQMASDIQSVLLAHHRAIVNHDFRAAWVLTSQRYRAKKLREPGGYDAWETAQASLSRYLDPSGLQVDVADTDPHSGVATIRVTGMGWSAPGSSCSSWQGVTWAKYENGHWRYEPGYSISDQRRAQWQPRRDELLGWGC